ncbi:MAG: tetratricopeptide repeat protein [Dermatophilaceae bacterium]
MKLSRRSTSVSDRTLSRLLWVGLLTLVIGIPTFGVIYYRDQHVDAVSSLLDRQVQSAEQAVRTAPGNIGLRLQLAAVYQAAKRPDSALTQYDATLKVQPTNRAALLGRGDVLVAKGDLTQAAASYQKIVGTSAKGEFASNDPQLAQAYSALGQIALKQGRAKDAVTSLESAVKIDPGDADAWYALGQANMKAGASKRAVEAFRTALKFVPTGWCEPYTQLAQVYQQLGDKPQADYAGAMVDFCQKRPADAKRRLQTLTSGPTAVDAMLGLGMIAETESDRQSAARWYQKVLGADPKNFNASAGLTRLGAGKTG